MRAPRFLLVTGPVLMACVLAPVRPARAELRADKVLASPTVKQAERVGLIIVASYGREATTARVQVRDVFEAARFQVTQLPTSTSEPARPLLLAHCAAHDLDAVALVRISTAAVGWTLSVELRDQQGAPIIAKFTHDGGPLGGQERQPVHARFSLAMTAASVAALQPEVAALVAPEIDSPSSRPRLWVSEKAVLFGGARIKGPDFYRLVGREDLAKTYQSNSTKIAIARGFGYTSLGIGTTMLVAAAILAGAVEGFCVVPNTYNAVQNQPQSCDDGVGALFVVPLAFGVTGGVLLAASAAISREPISLEAKRALAREYNARNASPPPAPPRAAGAASGVRLSLSGAPLAKAEGGVLLLGGRF